MKKNTMIAYAVCAVIPLLPVAASAAKVSLAGKKYEVDLAEGGKTSKDTLVFGKKDFESLQCRQYGFKPSKAKFSGTQDSIAFESEAKSKTEGVDIWSGYVKGQAVVATMTWKKKGQPDKVYNASGTEMAEPQAAAKPE
jgi:hypothetical protein